MKYENLPFPDAVEKLAQECGVKVVYDGKSTFNRNPEKPRLTDIMERAQKYYRNRFLDNSAAQKYIKDRGLTDETLEKFGIGFAPDGWHNLDSVFSPDDRKLLIDAGLQREGNGGSFYDFFRNRLMFPIRNIRGQIIAFSARTMIGEEPKYINTGDTPIFTKGKEVFGLYEARRSIQEKKRVIVVEGQMDAIQLSQAGFGESCAPLGTAIRSEHVERLLKMTDHIIFSFDGDTAGRKAALRAMDICLPLLEDAQKAVFVFLPEGEDPDSLVKNQGPEAFEKLISQGLPLSSYLIESTSRGLDLSILEDKGAFLDAAAPYIRKTKSVLLRDGLIERIATAAGYKDTDQLARYFGFEKVAPIAPRPSGFRNGASARFGLNLRHRSLCFCGIFCAIPNSLWNLRGLLPSISVPENSDRQIKFLRYCRRYVRKMITAIRFCLLLADFRLPQRRKCLNPRWRKSEIFSRHSCLLTAKIRILKALLKEAELCAHL